MLASSAYSSQSWLPAAVGVIVAIFGGGGVAALIKSRPEGSKILIDAAAGIVVVQTGVITSLRDQIEKSQRQSDLQASQLKEAQTQIEELRSHIMEMTALRVENDQLKVRLSEQEVKIQHLRARVAELEHPTKLP